jgi:hypothetical protein
MTNHHRGWPSIVAILMLAACSPEPPESEVALDCETFDAAAQIEGIRPWPEDRPGPADLEGSRDALDEWLTEPQRKYFACTDRDVLLANIHFGLAWWIRDNWRFDSTTPLGRYMQALGLQHPDDISNLIAVYYVYAVRDEDFDIDAEVQRYVDYWNVDE